MTETSDAGALVGGISLLSTVSLVSLVAMLPLGYLVRFNLPKWILMIAVISFAASMAINGVLVVLLAIGTAFRDFVAIYRQRRTSEAPPWEIRRQIDEMNQGEWYRQLAERLGQVDGPVNFPVPSGSELFQDPHTRHYWLRSMGNQGFGSFQVWLPIKVEHSQGGLNPFE